MFDMSRHTRTQGTNVTFVIVVLVGAAAWTHRAVLEHIAFIVLALLGCDLAMVVTNSTYSTTAQKLAAGNECALIDRKSLAFWVNNNGNIRGVIL